MFSSGLAKNGMIPFFAVYSTFLQRSYDQLIHDVAMQDLKVVFALTEQALSARTAKATRVYSIRLILCLFRI